MIFRLCICLFIPLISFQHPLPVLNSDVSQITYPDLQASKLKEKEDRRYNARFKRQVREDTLESHNYNQETQGNTEERTNEDRERNKRLETDEEGVAERNQFYKPVSEETKDNRLLGLLVNAKQDKEELEHKVADSLSAPAKLDVANIRSQRQYSDVFGDLQPENDREKIQNSEEFNDNSIQDEFEKSSNSLQKRERDSFDLQELTENRYLSPTAMETMRKINPLTIGDQVSKMIHDRKCNPQSKSGSKRTFGSGPSGLQNEDQIADSSISQQENDDTAKQSAYDKQQPPKIVHKPCPSNDYGFSVIILAGDPLKMGGAGACSENTGKEDKYLKKQKGNVSNNNASEAKTSGKEICRFGAKYSEKELRVQKNPNAKVEFPVYDQDLTVVPDPFNGLLEQNYWSDSVNKEDNNLFTGAHAFPPHRIRVRGAQKKNGKNLNKNDKKTYENNDTSVTNTTIIQDLRSNDTSDTTEENITGTDYVSFDSPTPELEEFADKINTNASSCMSWKESNSFSKNKNNTALDVW